MSEVQDAIAATEAVMQANRNAAAERRAKEAAETAADRADFEEAARMLGITSREVREVRLVPGLGVAVKDHTDNWYAILEPALVAEAGGNAVVGLTLRRDLPGMRRYESPQAFAFLAQVGGLRSFANEGD